MSGSEDRDWDAEREVAYRLSATIQEAALAGITLDGRDRRDLGRLLPGYEIVRAPSEWARQAEANLEAHFRAARPANGGE